MALPVIQLPLYEIEIPSTGGKTKFRPFTVKEEKILLMAQESKDSTQIILAIKQILNNCIDNIDVDKLAPFDIEYLLLHIRAKSVNDVLSFGITDPDTGEEIQMNIKVDDIKMEHNPDHTKKIKVNDEYILKMRYPTVDQLKSLDQDAEGDVKTDQLFSLMIGCVDSLANEDTVYKMDDFTTKEVTDFVENLSNTAIADIQKFFETMPKLRYETKYTNSTGKERTFVLEGTETFFM